MSAKDDAAKRADILCEFFEVITHNILYIRELYPHQIFTKSKKYGAIVYQSAHPQINEYIAECLKAVHFHLKSNQLKTFCICIVLKNDILERYVFDVIHNKTTNIEDLYIHLEQNFRDVCLKLTTISSYLEPLSKNAAFIIQLYVTESSSIQFNENLLNNDFPWIQVNLKSMPNADIVPIKGIDTDGLKLQSFIEKIKIDTKVDNSK